MPMVEREELDLNTRYNDYIVTSLRTMWGASLDTIRERFGSSFLHHCLREARQHLDSNLLRQDGDVLCLTEKGVFLSDGIISDLLWVE